MDEGNPLAVTVKICPFKEPVDLEIAELIDNYVVVIIAGCVYPVAVKILTSYDPYLRAG